MSEGKITALLTQLSAAKDEVRSKAFLSLKEISAQSPEVYRHWDFFRKMLQSRSTNQRVIGLMLMSENARWDTEGRLKQDYRQMLSLCEDEKLTTVRQTIQQIPLWAANLPEKLPEIIGYLMALDLSSYKDSQVNQIRQDRLQALIALNEVSPSAELDQVIQNELKANPQLKKALGPPVRKKQIKN